MYCQGNAMVCSFFLRYFQCYLCIIIFCQFYSTLFYSITQGHCWTGNVAAKIPEIFILWEGNQVCSVYRREDPFHSVVKTNLFHPFLSIMKLQTQRERRKKKKKDFFMTLVIFTTHVFYDPFFTSKKKKKRHASRWLQMIIDCSFEAAVWTWAMVFDSALSHRFMHNTLSQPGVGRALRDPWISSMVIFFTTGIIGW